MKKMRNGSLEQWHKIIYVTDEENLQLWGGNSSWEKPIGINQANDDVRPVT